MAYGQGRFMVAWHYRSSEDPNWDLHGRIVELDGNLPGNELHLVQGSHTDLAFGGCLVFDGRNFLLAWADVVESPVTGQSTVMGRLWTRDGTPVDYPFHIGDSAVGRIGVGLSTGNGKSLVIMHSNIFTETADVCGIFVSLPPSVGPLILAPGRVMANTFEVEMLGPEGARAVLEASADLDQWASVSTNLPSAEPLVLPVPFDPNAPRFFRGRFHP